MARRRWSREPLARQAAAELDMSIIKKDKARSTKPNPGAVAEARTPNCNEARELPPLPSNPASRQHATETSATSNASWWAKSTLHQREQQASGTLETSSLSQHGQISRSGGTSQSTTMHENCSLSEGKLHHAGPDCGRKEC
ncbi:hypothetical protein AC578_7070 [Pseudocercospora eumusae]|uniref:Uncharacterized protein n=1 Tax=Pseudocercospora eumusae TaxID=321146 RepID=A0A139HFZ0_9PEZI|nr:hypothetical protein AC578_7070 [Pseudocercospora eumusae]